MDNNILHQGISELYVARDLLVDLDEEREKRQQLEYEESKLEKVIELREKNIEDETTSTTKSRKEEVEASYNKQTDDLKNKIKKIKSKKEKSKSKKVSERIQTETEDLRSEVLSIRSMVKNIMKEHRLPKICSNNLFYSLYLPKGFSDFINIFIVLLLVLFIVPCGVYYFILKEQKILYLAIIYVIVVILVASIYMLIENNVKDKHIEQLREIRILKLRLRKNKKQQKKVTKQIQKDKDESVYELEDFDKELTELSNELDSINSRKEEAIKNFDSNTKYEIINEIKSRYEEEIKELKLSYEEKNKARKVIEEKIRNTALHIANTYEVYIGKEFMQVEVLEQLVTLMKEKNLKTVSEAVVEYKNEI